MEYRISDETITEELQTPMLPILPFLLCLRSTLSKTECRQLGQIALAVFSMTGRITQRGISRWTSSGGSYRTVHRFFQSAIDWRQVQWLFFQQFLHDPTDTYLLVGDETVLGKAGKKTYGLGTFFSSLAGRPIPGLAFFGLALVSTKRRHAYPLCSEQVIRSMEEKEQARQNRAKRATPKVAPSEKRKAGRL